MSNTPTATALNLNDIAARVDGLRITGNIVGLALVQVANAPADPMSLSGTVANSLFRRSYLPGFSVVGIDAEDLGLPENCMPGADFTDARIVRLTAARTIMPGSLLVNASTPRGNFQKADLRDVDGSGWNAIGAFFEEGNLSGLVVTPATVFHGAHLQDTRRAGVEFHAQNVVGADFGPESTSGTGQPRKAARIVAAAVIHAPTELGG